MNCLKFLCVCALGLATIFSSGCGPKRPAELPKTYPLSIVVKKAGAPMNEVTVSLHSDEAQGRWTIAGTTDETGTAEMRSICRGYIDKGAPEGEYKLLLTAKLSESAPQMPSESELRNMSEEEREKFSTSRDEYVKKRKAALVFPREYSSVKDTPFGVKVEQGAKVVEIEVEDAD